MAAAFTGQDQAQTQIRSLHDDGGAYSQSLAQHPDVQLDGEASEEDR